MDAPNLITHFFINDCVQPNKYNLLITNLTPYALWGKGLILKNRYNHYNLTTNYHLLLKKKNEDNTFPIYWCNEIYYNDVTPFS